uniref:Battenin n=1 Tax=Timema genevievae TaxID=629358 RepID=A0A7R9PN75_TIMGE|nr:unnamed protein product [Timema genevievae]
MMGRSRFKSRSDNSAKNENFTATQLCSTSLQLEESDPPLLWSLRANRHWRNLVAYWLLGLCNNYGYVVMLSAAHDILSQNFNTNTVVPWMVMANWGPTVSQLSCDRLETRQTGVLDPHRNSPLLGYLCPLLDNAHCARILLVVLLEAVGFILVAFATADWMALLGVVSTSLGSGLGEVTLLSYSTFFDKNVVSTWSSGTGGAGILGASSYAGLTSLGLSPSKALLIMLVIPALMAFS